MTLEDAIEKVVAGPGAQEPPPERRGQSAALPITKPATPWSPRYSQHADPVHKISIVPRGRAALGYTMQLPAKTSSC